MYIFCIDKAMQFLSKDLGTTTMQSRETIRFVIQNESFFTTIIIIIFTPPFPTKIFQNCMHGVYYSIFLMNFLMLLLSVNDIDLTAKFQSKKKFQIELIMMH